MTATINHQKPKNDDVGIIAVAVAQSFSAILEQPESTITASRFSNNRLGVTSKSSQQMVFANLAQLQNELDQEYQRIGELIGRESKR